MKFGLEVEKFLFDIKKNRPSEGVFRFLDALTDFTPDHQKNITNEFVMNMVEIIMNPSTSQMEIMKDYISDYVMFNSIARRESVVMVGLGSLPMQFQPHMTPKWAYFVQNSILDKKIQGSWVMNADSPLTPAGNCAGIHVHAEIETFPEYLFSNRELVDKFNLGLMLTPMIAFASSPYFFGNHEGYSSRGIKYYNHVYKDFPLNGSLPHVMESSEEVLKYFQFSTEHWVKAGVNVGLPEEDLIKLVQTKGASWNPVRWNRKWNTIELRCMDSDRIDLDCAKFVWATTAFKRMDLKGENLKCDPLPDQELTLTMIAKSFTVRDGLVSILPTSGIKEIFNRAMKDGLNDKYVLAYMWRLHDFVKDFVPADCKPVFSILEKVLETKESTSQKGLMQAESMNLIDREMGARLITTAIEDEKRILKDFYSLIKDSET